MVYMYHVDCQDGRFFASPEEVPAGWQDHRMFFGIPDEPAQLPSLPEDDDDDIGDVDTDDHSV